MSHWSSNFEEPNENPATGPDAPMPEVTRQGAEGIGFDMKTSGACRAVVELTLVFVFDDAPRLDDDPP
jgi:hypothetical protein